MARNRQQVDPQVVDADRDLPHGLGAVGVDKHSSTVGNLDDLPDGLDGADFVVGVHYGHQNRLGRDGLLHLLGRYHAHTVDGKVSHRPSLAFQVAADLLHGRVLDGRSDDVVARVPVRPRHAPDRVVVGLGAVAGEDDLVVVAAKHPSKLPPCQLDAFPRRPAEGVAAGGVTEVAVDVGRHGLCHLGVDRRGGIVVQVDCGQGRASRCISPCASIRPVLIWRRTGLWLTMPATNGRALKRRYSREATGAMHSGELLRGELTSIETSWARIWSDG